MLEKLILYLMEHPESAYFLYPLIIVVAMAWALHKEWLILGPYHAQTVKDYAAQTTTLNEVREALTDQLVLNERATVTIEFMKADADRLKLELAEARAAGHRPRKA